MVRIIAQLAKWILLCLVGLILYSINYLVLVAFVVFLIWRSNVKRKRQYESDIRENAKYVKEHSEEFEVIDVTGTNEDGKDRQAIFIRCYRGDTIKLEFKPTEDQPYRVEVWTKFGMIGYLAPYDVAKHIGFFRSSETPSGEIKKLTGGTLDKPELGCIVSVFLQLSETEASEEKQPVLDLEMT